MKRRTLFSKLGVAAAALAVAPAVTVVDATPLTATDDPPLDMDSWTRGYLAGHGDARYGAPSIDLNLASDQWPSDALLMAEYERGLVSRSDFMGEFGIEAYPPMTGWVGQIQGHAFTPPGKTHDEIGCSTCWAIEHQPYTPLTFEVMATDCAARGCDLLARDGCAWHVGPDPTWRMQPIAHRFGELPSDLARVDAWRRSLHGNAASV